jgi:hypothetical protein
VWAVNSDLDDEDLLEAGGTFEVPGATDGEERDGLACQQFMKARQILGRTGHG